jgi:hypothetical protein
MLHPHTAVTVSHVPGGSQGAAELGGKMILE